MVISTLVRALAAASLLSMLAGCTWLLTPLLMIDPNKAREVVTFDIGQAGVSTRSIDLRSGDASIMFVARGYDCQQPLNGTLEVTVQGARNRLMHHELTLDQLTWRREPCQPVAYLQLHDGDQNQIRPLEFRVRRGDNPLRFTFDLKQAAADPGQPLSIWVIYNDRAPTWRMLRDSGYSLGAILNASGPQASARYRPYATGTRDGVIEGVSQLAELVKRHAMRALQGDTAFYDLLEEWRQRSGENLELDVLESQIRPKAAEASRTRDYARAAELYAQILRRLTPAELKKLKIARERAR